MISDSGSEEGLRTVKQAKLVDHFLRRYRLRGDCNLILTKGDITTWSIDGHSDAIVSSNTFVVFDDDSSETCSGQAPGLEPSYFGQTPNSLPVNVSV